MASESNPWKSRISLLDDIARMINSSPDQKQFAALFNRLRTLRQSAPSQKEWQDFCKNDIPQLAITSIQHEDPFSFRAYSQPRGYPGDAELIDMIYFPYKIWPTLSGMARDVNKYTSNSPACRAVRYRRYRIAELVDSIAAQKSGAKVVSVACGHLREAELSLSVKHGSIDLWLGIDQDPLSLAEIENSAYHPCVTTLKNSVRDILKSGKLTLDGQSFDSVYSAGLYDYLEQPVAQRLTQIMFDATVPGGTVMVANFLPDVPDVGYMEAIMNWQLIYRNPDQLRDVASTVNPETIQSMRTYIEPNNNIVFLEIVKKS